MIKDILEMQKELQKLGDEDYYYQKMWKIFESYKEKTPQLKSGLKKSNK